MLPTRSMSQEIRRLIEMVLETGDRSGIVSLSEGDAQIAVDELWNVSSDLSVSDSSSVSNLLISSQLRLVHPLTSRRLWRALGTNDLHTGTKRDSSLLCLLHSAASCQGHCSSPD